MVGEVNNTENVLEPFPVIDRSFWSEPPLSGDLSGWLSGSNDIMVDAVESFLMDGYNNGELTNLDQSYTQVIDEEGMDFWYDLFAQEFQN